MDDSNVVALCDVCRAGAAVLVLKERRAKEATIDELKGKLESLESNNQLLLGKVNQLVEMLRKERQDAQAAAETSLQRIMELKAKMEGSTHDTSALKDKIDILEAEKEALHNQLSDARDQLSSMQRRVQENSATLLQQLQDEKKLRMTLEKSATTTTNSVQYEKELRVAAERETGELKFRLEQLQQQNSKRDSLIEKIVSGEKTRRAEQQALQDKVASLEAELNDKNLSIAQLEGRLSMAEGLLNSSGSSSLHKSKSLHTPKSKPVLDTTTSVPTDSKRTTPTNTPRSAAPEQIKVCVRVTQDFTATAEGEMSCLAGDILFAQPFTEDEPWVLARGGQAFGMVPSAVLEVISSGNLRVPLPESQLRVAHDQQLLNARAYGQSQTTGEDVVGCSVLTNGRLMLKTASGREVAGTRQDMVDLEAESFNVQEGGDVAECKTFREVINGPFSHLSKDILKRFLREPECRRYLGRGEHPQFVFVVGGNKGIGLWTCKQLLSSPIDAVVVVGCRDPSRLADCISSLRLHSPGAADRVHGLLIDLGDDESVAKAANEYCRLFPFLDVLILNSATVVFDEAEASGLSFSGNAARETFNVNLKGPVRVLNAFTPILKQSMEKRRSSAPNLLSVKPRIVNVSSAGALYAFGAMSEGAKATLFSRHSVESLCALADEYVATYCSGGKEAIAAKGFSPLIYHTSKLFLNGITQAVALDDTISCTAVHPGLSNRPCLTDMVPPTWKGRNIPYLTPAEGAAVVVESALHPQQSGSFVCDGHPIPWSLSMIDNLPQSLAHVNNAKRVTPQSSS
ncbi:carbonyl reductase 1 [Pelomyxa schiedti]|nr:carbonyl reductase 1 [Pelomyxa schiedti]